jgi:hypothetical protein
MSESPLAAGTGRTVGWRQLPVLVLGLTGLLAVMLTAFMLPTLNSGPQDVPIAIAGAHDDAAQVAGQLEQAEPGAFDVRLLPDAEAATAAIDAREVYGAVVVSNTAPEILVASTASTQIANALRNLAPALADESPRSPVQVHDLHPLPADDPFGAGLAAGALPLVLGGYIAAVIITMLVRGTAQRAAGAFGFAIVGGFALTALLQYGFGVVNGSYLLTALALTLTIAATCWGILGLRGLFGNAGIGLGAAVMILLGNPLSGLSGGKEWLPAPWGEVGQFLPPGAGGTLLRSTAFFDGAGAAHALVVLMCWLIGGIALFVYGVRRGAVISRRRAADEDAAAPVLTG